jgi:hypothetical protein
MLLPVEPVGLFDLASQRLCQLVLPRPEQRNGIAVGQRELNRVPPRAGGIDAGIGQDHDGRLQPLGAMHGHDPHCIERRRRITDDLDIAAREPVEKGLKRGRGTCLEIQGAGQEFFDRVARLGPEPLQQLAAAFHRPGQDRLQELMRRRVIGHVEQGAKARQRLGIGSAVPKLRPERGALPAVGRGIELILAPAEQGRDEQAG